MTSRKVTTLARSYAAERGWEISIVNQPQWLFPDDGRRLKRVAIPSDPYWAYLVRDDLCAQGIGASPDEAVIAAIPPCLRDSLRRCELAVDSLHGCLQKLLREENKEDRFDAESDQAQSP